MSFKENVKFYRAVQKSVIDLLEELPDTGGTSVWASSSAGGGDTLFLVAGGTDVKLILDAVADIQARKSSAA